MFTTCKSGAEEEIEVVAYVKDGAEQEAEAAYMVKNGAEEEVWTNVIYLDLSSNTLTAQYNVDLTPSESGFSLSCPFSSGSIDVTLDEELVNPTITYRYYGGMTYHDDTGTYHKVAGRVRAFALSTSGSYTYGTRYSIGNASDFSVGTVTENFTGTFTRIGLEVTSIECGLSEFSGSSLMSISEIMINGKECALDPEDAI